MGKSSLNETSFKVLMYGGQYVDDTTGMLEKGIYGTHKPHLFRKDDTIESIIERGERIKDIVGTQMIPQSYFTNLRKCELVEVTLTIKGTPSLTKSQEIELEASAEENDIKAFALHNKSMREKRAERSNIYIKKLNAAGFTTTEFPKQGKITIEPTKFGTVDYYYRANKILIRKQNKWLNAGANWILKNLLD